MVEKAKIKVLDTNETIDVMYNPTEYTYSEKAELKKVGRLIQQEGLKKEDFTVNLFFDTYEKRENVATKTRAITDLIKPIKEEKETKRPYVCLFTWGEFSYKGIINKITQKFTLFLETGIPVRAELTVTFIPPESVEEQKQNKGKHDSRKMWKVKKGDRLDLIAHTALHDAGLWKKIAETNKIVNPLEFPTEKDIGRTIFIPHLG